MVNGSLTGPALTSRHPHFPPDETVAVMIEAPNIPSLNGLVELAHRDGVDIRPTLLR
jgi:hypothetical protein